MRRAPRASTLSRAISFSLSLSLSLVRSIGEDRARSLPHTHGRIFFPAAFTWALLLSRCYPASTPLCTTFLAPSFISLSLRTSRLFPFLHFLTGISLFLFFPLSDQFRRLLLIFVIFVKKRTYLFPFSLAIIIYGLQAEPEEREGGKERNKREKYSTLSFSLSHGSLCAFANARRLWEAANASVYACDVVFDVD